MTHKTIITASKHRLNIDWAELWSYRELLWTLTMRDIKVMYAQTWIGILWALIKPVVSIAILSFVFGMIAKVGTGTAAVPHILYTAVGLCGWTYFSSLVGQAGQSILGAQQMIKKIYFPRIVLPLSKALTAGIDLSINLMIVAVLMIYYKYTITVQLVYLPLFILMAIISGLAGGIWMSALTIRFRDFLHVTPLMLRVGMYITPIAFPVESVPMAYQSWFYLNPMVGVVQGFRWSILGAGTLDNRIYISFAVITVMFVLGLYYFNHIQRKIADII